MGGQDEESGQGQFIGGPFSDSKENIFSAADPLASSVKAEEWARIIFCLRESHRRSSGCLHGGCGQGSMDACPCSRSLWAAA